MTEKVFGYLLIALGILIILFSTISVFDVFTRKAKPVQLFNFKGIKFDMSQMLIASLPPETAALLPQNRNEAKGVEIIPAQLINDTSNVFAHLLLMSFIAGIGSKLANIGVLLVRPIVVKLKTKEVKESVTSR